MPPASSSSPSCSRSASSSRWRKTTCRRSSSGCAPARRCRSPPSTAAAPPSLATGELKTLDNQIDTTTGTLKLRAEFANEDEGLFPNQFVNIQLLVDVLHNATDRADERDPARRARHVRLPRQCRQYRRGEAGRRSARPAASGSPCSPGLSPGDASSSMAPTSCATAPRSVPRDPAMPGAGRRRCGSDRRGTPASRQHRAGGRRSAGRLPRIGGRRRRGSQ